MLKGCTQYIRKLGKLSSNHRTKKVQFLFQSQRTAMTKTVQTATQLRSSHMLKILQARLQQYMICELPDVQAGVRKGRGTRDQIAGSWKNLESSRKTSISVLLTMLKPLTVWITTENSGKFLKRWEYQTT